MPIQLPLLASDYLAAVRDHLAGLPAEEQSDLLLPVEQRLLELPAEELSARRLAELFGSPQQLAADLRTAAGHPEGPVPAAAVEPSWVRRWLITQAARPRLAPAFQYLDSLRPAWWALRGLLLVSAGVAALDNGGWRLHRLGLYLEPFGGTQIRPALFWLLFPVAVVASILVGRLTPRLPGLLRRLPLLLNVVAVVALLAWPTWWVGPSLAYYSGLVG
jgi:hypothetical protein